MADLYLRSIANKSETGTPANLRLRSSDDRQGLLSINVNDSAFVSDAVYLDGLVKPDLNIPIPGEDSGGIFITGAEGTGVDEWSWYNQTNATYTAVAEAAYKGTKGFKSIITSATASYEAEGDWSISPSSVDEIYMRFYLNLDGIGLSTAGSVGYFQICSITSDNELNHQLDFGFHFDATGAFTNFYMEYNDTANRADYNTSKPSGWHCYEVHAKRGTTNGIAQVWIDGTLVIDIQNATCNGIIQRAEVGIDWCSYNYAIGNYLYTDCIKIDSSYIGPLPAGDFYDTASVSDVPTVSIDSGVSDLSINIFDTSNVSDSIVITEDDSVISIVDNSNVSDNISIGQDDFVINIFDTGNVSDLVTLAKDDSVISISDNCNVSDNMSIALDDLVINVADTCNTSDNISVTQDDYAVNIYDTLNVSDYTSVTKDDSTINISDNVNTTDSITETKDDSSINLFDNNTAVDYISLIFDDLTISVYDNINASDNISTVKDDCVISIVDNSNVTDNVSVDIQFEINTYDSVNVSDYISLILDDLNISIIDNVNVLDNITLTKDDYSVSIIDNNTITDYVSVNYDLEINVNDVAIVRDINVSDEKITAQADREFSTDTGYWSIGTGWSISGNTLNFNTTDWDWAVAAQKLPNENRRYEVQFDIISLSDGGIWIRLGDSTGEPIHYSTGTFVDVIDLINWGNIYVRTYPDTSAIGSVDNISVKEVLPYIAIEIVTDLNITVNDTVNAPDNISASKDDSIINIYESVIETDYVELLIIELFIDIYDNAFGQDYFDVLNGTPYLDIADYTNASDYTALILSDNEINIYDNGTVQDVPTVGLQATETLLININDNSNISDSITISLDDYVISIVDNINATDNVIITKDDYLISVSDLSNTSDYISLIFGDVQINISDNINVNDSVVIAKDDLIINVYDSCSITDSVELTKNDDSVSVYDSISVSDLIDAVLSDTEIDIYDKIIANIEIPLQDINGDYVLDINDEQIYIWGDGDYVEVLISDSEINVYDEAVVSDIPNIQLGSIADLDVDVFDSVIVTDYLSLVFDFNINTYDSISVSETISVVENDLEVNIIDNIAVEDSLYELGNETIINSENRDFEGISTDWQTYYSVLLQNSVVHSGNKALKVEYDTQSAWRASAFLPWNYTTTTAYDIVDVSFWVKGEYGVYEFIVDIFNPQNFNVPDSDWHKYTFTKVPAIYGSVLIASLNNEFYLDDVSIKYLITTIKIETDNTVVDNINVSDAVNVFTDDIVINVTDNLTAQDIPTVSIQDAETYQINLFDISNVSDFISVNFELEIFINDISNISDSVLLGTDNLEINIFDTCNTSDSAQIVQDNYAINIYDTSSVTDNVEIAKDDYIINIFDNINCLELVSLEYDSLEISIYDDLFISEFINFIISDNEINIYDNVISYESIQIETDSLEINIYDYANVLDYNELLIEELFIEIFDNVFVEDIVSFENGENDIIVVDYVNVNDLSQEIISNNEINIYDDIIIEDAPIVYIESAEELYINVYDNSNVEDFIEILPFDSEIDVFDLIYALEYPTTLKEPHSLAIFSEMYVYDTTFIEIEALNASNEEFCYVEDTIFIEISTIEELNIDIYDISFISDFIETYFEFNIEIFDEIYLTDFSSLEYEFDIDIYSDVAIAEYVDVFSKEEIYLDLFDDCIVYDDCIIVIEEIGADSIYVIDYIIGQDYTELFVPELNISVIDSANSYDAIVVTKESAISVYDNINVSDNTLIGVVRIILSDEFGTEYENDIKTGINIGYGSNISGQINIISGWNGAYNYTVANDKIVAVIRSSTGVGTHVLDAQLIYPRVQTFFPLGANTFTQLYTFSVDEPPVIVVTGAGDFINPANDRNNTAYGKGLEFWDHDLIISDTADQSAFSNGIILGKLLYIKDTLNCTWWEARYRARATADRTESNRVTSPWDLYNGYGRINVSNAIAYVGVIPEDPYLKLDINIIDNINITENVSVNVEETSTLFINVYDSSLVSDIVESEYFLPIELEINIADYIYEYEDIDALPYTIFYLEWLQLYSDIYSNCELESNVYTKLEINSEIVEYTDDLQKLELNSFIYIDVNIVSMIEEILFLDSYNIDLNIVSPEYAINVFEGIKVNDFIQI